MRPKTGVAIVFASVAVGACRPPEPVYSRVDLLVSDRHEAELVGYLFAKAHGLDRKQQIDLHIIPVGPETDPVAWLSGRNLVAVEDTDAKWQKLPYATAGAPPKNRFAILCAPEFAVAELDFPISMFGLIGQRSLFSYYEGVELADRTLEFSPQKWPIEGFATAVASLKNSKDLVDSKQAKANRPRKLVAGVRPDREGAILYGYLIYSAQSTMPGTQGKTIAGTPINSVAATDPGTFWKGAVDLWPANSADEGQSFENHATALPLTMDPGNVEMYGPVLAGPEDADPNLAHRLRDVLWQGWNQAQKMDLDSALRLFPDYGALSADEKSRRKESIRRFSKDLVDGFDPRKRAGQTFSAYMDADQRWQMMFNRFAKLGLSAPDFRQEEVPPNILNSLPSQERKSISTNQKLLRQSISRARDYIRDRETKSLAPRRSSAIHGP